ncbi:MAG: hypothetical protein ABI972_17230 [Acidobacteriota bacterium]
MHSQRLLASVIVAGCLLCSRADAWIVKTGPHSRSAHTLGLPVRTLAFEAASANGVRFASQGRDYLLETTPDGIAYRYNDAFGDADSWTRPEIVRVHLLNALSARRWQGDGPLNGSIAAFSQVTLLDAYVGADLVCHGHPKTISLQLVVRERGDSMGFRVDGAWKIRHATAGSVVVKTSAAEIQIPPPLEQSATGDWVPMAGGYVLLSGGVVRWVPAAGAPAQGAAGASAQAAAGDSTPAAASSLN